MWVFALPKFFELLLKVSYFVPFNPFWLAGALNNYIWGTLDFLKDYFGLFIYLFAYIYIYIFISFVVKSPSGGKKSMENVSCESKVACKFSKKCRRWL